MLGLGKRLGLEERDEKKACVQEMGWVKAIIIYHAFTIKSIKLYSIINYIFQGAR